MTPWYTFLALSVLAVACTYAFAYWRGHTDGRVDGYLQRQAELEDEERELFAELDRLSA